MNFADVFEIFFSLLSGGPQLRTPETSQTITVLSILLRGFEGWFSVGLDEWDRCQFSHSSLLQATCLRGKNGRNCAVLCIHVSVISTIHVLRDFSSFDEMLVHLKLQTWFALPGLISAIRSLKKIPLKLNEFEPVMYNHVYRIRQFQCIL